MLSVGKVIFPCWAARREPRARLTTSSSLPFFPWIAPCSMFFAFNQPYTQLWTGVESLYSLFQPCSTASVYVSMEEKIYRDTFQTVCKVELLLLPSFGHWLFDIRGKAVLLPLGLLLRFCIASPRLCFKPITSLSFSSILLFLFLVVVSLLHDTHPNVDLKTHGCKKLHSWLGANHLISSKEGCSAS